MWRVVIDGKLDAPFGFAVGPDGDLYVAERKKKQRVRRFSSKTERKKGRSLMTFRTCRSSSLIFPERVPKRLHSFLLTRLLKEFTNPSWIRVRSRYQSEHTGWSSGFALSLRRMRTPLEALAGFVPGASGKRSSGGYGVGHFSLKVSHYAECRSHRSRSLRAMEPGLRAVTTIESETT